MGFHLSLGQAHELQDADVILETLLDQIAALLADIAYVAKARLLERLEEHQVGRVSQPACAQESQKLRHRSQAGSH